MGKVRGFILSHFGKNYLLIFLPFFSILSIVYIIRIAILSNKITLDTGEILTLFGFFLPDIIFYTLPLSFIAAATATLMKLSEDNELIALFSFGLTPTKLLKIFTLPALLFTILMLIISLYTIPQSTLAYKLFEKRKTVEAELTIAPNRLGQKFGDYMVFLGDKKNHTYHDVVLFATDNKEKRVLVIADKGHMEHHNAQFSLNLSHGTGDTFLPHTIESIRYEQMHIYNYTQNNTNVQWLSRGWSDIGSNKNDMALFIYNIFLSLSPLLVLGLITAFSIVNPRYQRSGIYLVSFGIAIAVYITASVLRKQGTPLLLLLVSLLFLAAGLFFFRTRTKASF
jgi:lipopolysaccharide export system permease protein